ncbi:MAG TPA: hypothetical protein VFR15_16780 [Chloroflexia bacterium]|nr:hypothetical protein [Chloroflexia bacterium]
MSLAEQYSTPLFTGTAPGAVDAVAESILRTLAYSDLFDYPLTPEEIWRYQAGTGYSAVCITRALERDAGLGARVARHDAFYALRGREKVFGTRAERAELSRPVWRRARAYARILARLPYVRMVAVTGALAMNNLGDRPDIDFMVVTRAGRVWIARRLIIGLVRLARLAGDELCPNYIIADINLEIDQRDLFTAHELAQMVPLAGERVYRALLASNTWASEYLPVAFREPFALEETRRLRPIARFLERALQTRALDRWEAWEMRRLRGRLRPVIGEDAEVVCSPEQCKGHTGRHRHWITTRYQQRLSELGLSGSARP